jgi:hypothetical protein
MTTATMPQKHQTSATEAALRAAIQKAVNDRLKAVKSA